MKYLITGGAGFIGSNFCHYVVDKYPDDEFICIDCLTYAGNFNNIKDLLEKKNFRFYCKDIANRIHIFELFEKENIDVVVNFAAESHVDRSIADPSAFWITNIFGTTVLLDACLKYNVKRYHQISTDEVYGDLPLDRPDLLFKETTPLHPSSPYSSSKANADLICMAYHRTYGLPVTISRCSNNYGPYQFPEKLIPVVINKALNNELVPVYGEGKNVRDWINVYDHNTGIDLILRKGKVGEVYNLGGHSEVSNIELVKKILKYLNKSEDLIQFVEDRKGHDLRYAIDSSKIEKELGWTRKCSFEKSLKETIDWYLDNKQWIADIVTKKYIDENNFARSNYR